MTSMRTIGLMGRCFEGDDTTGWLYEPDGPFDRYTLDIGSGWHMRSDFGNREWAACEIVHPGETAISMSMRHAVPSGLGLRVSGFEHHVYVPVTPMDPECDGIPPLTEDAKDALIDLAMGGGYRDVIDGTVIPLDADRDMTMTVIRRKEVHSMPQVICRVGFTDPEGGHPGFEFIGRLRVNEGRVTIRNWRDTVTFDIPARRVLQRLDAVPPRIPLLRGWLRDNGPDPLDARLSSMRDEMREALGLTGFQEGDVVYLRCRCIVASPMRLSVIQIGWARLIQSSINSAVMSMTDANTNNPMIEAAAMATQILEQAMWNLYADNRAVPDIEDVPLDPISIEFESNDMKVTLRMSVLEAKGLVDRLSKAIVSAETKGLESLSLVTGKA